MVPTLIPHGSVDSSNEVNISLAILSRSERISAKLLVPVNKKEIVNKQTKQKYKHKPKKHIPKIVLIAVEAKSLVLLA